MDFAAVLSSKRIQVLALLLKSRRLLNLLVEAASQHGGMWQLPTYFAIIHLLTCNCYLPISCAVASALPLVADVPHLGGTAHRVDARARRPAVARVPHGGGGPLPHGIADDEHQRDVGALSGDVSGMMSGPMVIETATLVTMIANEIAHLPGTRCLYLVLRSVADCVAAKKAKRARRVRNTATIMSMKKRWKSPSQPSRLLLVLQNRSFLKGTANEFLN